MDEDYTRERLVASFMEVTGVVSAVDACDHLSCCGWKLDEAVDLFLSVGAGTSGSRSPPPPSSSAPDDDDEENFMRAPVARSSGTQRGGRANDGDDQRRSSASGSSRRVSRWDSETRVSSSSSNNSRSSRRKRRRERIRERGNDDGSRLPRARARVGRDEDGSRIEVDGDLTRRLQLYDKALNNSGSEHKNAAPPAAKEEKEEEEEKSLEDLFRPPRELTFAGDFHDAKTHAARRARWLLVNVQDTGEAALASFAQNRDVWASGLVAQFVRDHFVLWQADADEAQGPEGAEEARKVCSHYGIPLDKLPAVLVVDPVTGQAMARLHGASTDPNDFLVAVKSYIATKPVIPVIGAKKPGASANEPVNQESATTAPASSQRTGNRQDVSKVEEQDKAVPAVPTVAPIVEKLDNAVTAVKTVAPTVEKQSKAVHAVVPAMPTVQPAPTPVPKVCKLRIRLPDGRTVAKEFASGCPVAALFAYCRSEMGQGEAGRNKPFRLMRLVGCTREEIGDRNASFEDLGLHLSTVSVLLG